MISDALAQFKVGMKCITIEDMPRFYKAGGDLTRVITSIKLDGARLHAFTDDTAVAHKSYNLKDFQNFGCLTDGLRALYTTRAIRDLRQNTLMFDGEVLDRHAKTRNEKFKGVMQQLHRIYDLDDSGFQFHAFDFWFPGMRIPQAVRLSILQSAVRELQHERIAYHVHRIMNLGDAAGMNAYFEQVIATGAEGLVLKIPNSMYEMRHSPNWVKLVAEYTIDLPVTGIIEGKGKLQNHIGKFICDMNGRETLVGPGAATHDQLREWFVYPERRPTMIEVKFKEYTLDGALRLPRYYRRRDDKFGAPE